MKTQNSVRYVFGEGSASKGGHKQGMKECSCMNTPAIQWTARMFYWTETKISLHGGIWALAVLTDGFGSPKGRSDNNN